MGHMAHGRASTDELLKNLGRSGSRHNGGHKLLLLLILLMFFRHVIPCAMVLRPMARSPRCTGLLSHPSPCAACHRQLAGLDPSVGDQDHTLSPSPRPRPSCAAMTSIASRFLHS